MFLHKPHYTCQSTYRLTIVLRLIYVYYVLHSNVWSVPYIRLPQFPVQYKSKYSYTDSTLPYYISLHSFPLSYLCSIALHRSLPECCTTFSSRYKIHREDSKRRRGRRLFILFALLHHHTFTPGQSNLFSTSFFGLLTIQFN